MEINMVVYIYFNNSYQYGAWEILYIVVMIFIIVYYFLFRLNGDLIECKDILIYQKDVKYFIIYYQDEEEYLDAGMSKEETQHFIQKTVKV